MEGIEIGTGVDRPWKDLISHRRDYSRGPLIVCLSVGRFVGTQRVGFATSEYGRDYRLGTASRRSAARV